jgi:hypothetical protein
MFQSYSHPHPIYRENSIPVDGRDPGLSVEKIAVGVSKNTLLTREGIIRDILQQRV